MDCNQNVDDILLLAAGALDGPEAEALRGHLAGGCPRCAGQWAEAEATLALLALTLPPALPSRDARRRLVDRLNREEAPAPIAGPRWWALLAVPSAIAASIAAGITIFFVLRIQQLRPPGPSNEALTLLSAMVAQQQQQISALRGEQSAQAESARTVAWASDPDLKTLWLSGTASQPPTAGGRVFWQTDKGVWHFYATGLKPAPAGKTYELWFVSQDGKTALPAGSFDPSPAGEAMLQTQVPASIAPTLAIAAVTDEPAGATITAPTGSFQLKGSLP